MEGLGRHIQAAAIARLRNKRMAAKLLDGRSCGAILAATDTRFYQSATHECLWLR